MNLCLRPQPRCVALFLDWGLWLGFLLVGFGGLSGCGLLSSELQAPTESSIQTARARDVSTWEALDKAYEIYREQGWTAFEDFFQAQQPASIRLEILRQDLLLEQRSIVEVRQQYRLRYEAGRDAPAAFLYGRIAATLAEQRSLMEYAIKSDPHLLPARVALIRRQPFEIGDDERLQALLEVLHEDPGSAEAWRLLREIAADYERTDLARMAAMQEPWSPRQDPQVVLFGQVQALLNDSHPESALNLLEEEEVGGLSADLFRASALADLGRLAEAWAVLEDSLERNPQDPQLRFDRGLLARDYLHWPDVAKEEFEAFLRLAEDSEQVPYRRRLQVESWLRKMAQT